MKKVKTDRYNHKKIEDKWNKIWEEEGVYKIDILKANKPYYNLMMYPYPSAEGLHVGNVYAFVGSDIHGRYMRMKGLDVFEPIGFDSGGIHSENFAIKMGIHPKKMIAKNIANFTKQLKKIGNMFSWDYTVDAMDPNYYKFTQWIFVKLFEAGLVYKKEAPVTWCPSCKTTVSDEQTEKKSQTKNSKYKANICGEITVCERCKTEVIRKNMSQWFFKITDYAEKLLENTYKLNWSEKVLSTQRNWIGKSEGAEIEFGFYNLKLRIKVFTTRPDTLFGCSFMAIAPEHQLCKKIIEGKIKIREEKFLEINKYIEKSKKKTEQERKIGNRDKTGVFSGLYVINPVNKKKVPVWIADYVVMDYGEGAVMGVPAHDKRDFEFAKKYDLEVIAVVKPSDDKNAEKLLNKELCWEGKGEIINSLQWNGKKYPENLDEIIMDLKNKGIGKKKITYKLRDWCISRQRYWGPPIPMIYCEKCAKKTQNSKLKTKNQNLKFINDKEPRIENDMRGWYPVPEEELPVMLPETDDYLPDGTGKSPLARNKEFMETKCPYCGAKAKRETDVSDTFLDSSWYFLRYPNIQTQNFKLKTQNTKEEKPWKDEIMKKWMPVDKYCGGAEHSVLHLLYSRFITMALYDLGLVKYDCKKGLEGEPFPNFYAHGLIIKDGAKMSKSRGNVINPDEYTEKFGTDTLRMYLSFIGPYASGGDFRDTGIAGMRKFIRRIWNLINENKKISSKFDKIIERKIHLTIKKVTEGIEKFKYNTSIAALMEMVGFLEKLDNREKENVEVSNKYELAVKTLVLLTAPFAPYTTEELWQKVNYKEEYLSVHCQNWPRFDKNKIKSEKVKIAVQVNGKLRSVLTVNFNRIKDKEFIIEKAKKIDKVNKYFNDKKILREIYIPGKIVNFVVES